MAEGTPGRTPAQGRPAEGTVELWSASLEPPASLGSALAACLSPDERARAERFVAACDRDRFVAGRAFLRLLLGQSTGAEPRELSFRYSAHGKPALADEGSDLEFNLAHSGTVVVCALAQGCEALGVDVECVKPIRDAAGLARRAFSPREAVRLDSLPEPVRLRAFYEAWTRKEAFLKALGCGLDRPLDSFDVAFGPGERPRLLQTLGDPTEADRFSLHSFEPEDGYIGAIAVLGAGWELRYFRWLWSETATTTMPPLRDRSGTASTGRLTTE